MSSDRQAVRLSMPLRGVRRTDAAAPAPSTPDAAAQERVAEERRRLETAARQLAVRERALAEREAELVRAQKALEGRLEELARLIGSVHEEKAELLEANEEEIISLSLSITQKVLQYEIENGRYRIAEVVRSTLQAVRDRGALVVRVNPRDYEMTRAAVEELAQTFGSTRITAVPDESIPLASCCIETDSGKIFSEIPGRLEKVERSLLKKNGS